MTVEPAAVPRSAVAAGALGLLVVFGVLVRSPSRRRQAGYAVLVALAVVGGFLLGRLVFAPMAEAAVEWLAMGFLVGSPRFDSGGVSSDHDGGTY